MSTFSKRSKFKIDPLKFEARVRALNVYNKLNFLSSTLENNFLQLSGLSSIAFLEFRFPDFSFLGH